VQFHPEYNIDIMKAYIKNQAEDLIASGRNIDEIMMTVKETPHASSIMKRFTQVCKQDNF
jgi:GMP synthase (glutamine-hydrolysing)